MNKSRMVPLVSFVSRSGSERGWSSAGQGADLDKFSGVGIYE